MTRLERQRLIAERLAAMTPAEYAYTCNGVGPKMNVCFGEWGEKVLPLARILRVPERIKLLLRGAADLHDVGYELGGTEVDKMHDDTWFLANGLDAVYAEDNTALVDSWIPSRTPKRLRPWLIKCGCFFVRLYDRIWTYICYTLVRVCGGQFFNYKT